MRKPLPWSRSADAVALVVLLPMVALIVSRLFGLDDRSGRVFAVQTLLPIALVPAYVVGVALLLARRWLLAATATAVVLAHLVWTLPYVGLPTSSGPADGQEFSLLAANVAADNSAPERVAAALSASDADVVVVIELTPALEAELGRSGFAKRYPHRVVDARTGFFGSGIYSVFPIEGAQQLEVAGLPTVRGTLVLGNYKAALVAVHTIQPLADLATLQRQHAELRELADTTDGPLILAGDFNATTQHRPFRTLLRSRLRDSHITRGRGLARTWPADMGTPPFALLDHVLVSEEFFVVSVREVDIPHSDHRGVRADLRLR